MEETSRVMMREKVTVQKFDKTHEDNPAEPIETVVQETVTEISLADAMLLGFVPQGEQIEASGSVQIGGSESAGVGVGD